MNLAIDDLIVSCEDCLCFICCNRLRHFSINSITG